MLLEAGTAPSYQSKLCLLMPELNIAHQWTHNSLEGNENSNRYYVLTSHGSRLILVLSVAVSEERTIRHLDTCSQIVIHKYYVQPYFHSGVLPLILIGAEAGRKSVGTHCMV